MQDLKFILPLLLLMFGVPFLIVFLIDYTPTHTISRYDNNVVCTRDKGWGFQKEARVCYGIYELKVDTTIHYEPIK